MVRLEMSVDKAYKDYAIKIGSGNATEGVRNALDLYRYIEENKHEIANMAQIVAFKDRPHFELIESILNFVRRRERMSDDETDEIKLSG